MIKWILWIATLVAASALVVVTVIWVKHPTSNIEQQRVYLDAYRAIGIAFLVALLGTIIPNLIQEGRDNLERARKSRIAYSQAKTSVIYLPGTLAVMQYGDAMSMLERCHRKLHVAETYGKELDEYLNWFGDRAIWSDLIYWKLTAVRRLLQVNADDWKDKSFGERTMMVNKMLEAVQKLFGKRGAKWKELTEETRDQLADSTISKIIGSSAV